MEEMNDDGSPVGVQSLTERLSHIRSSPNLQSQKQSAVILSAVEDTLKEQNSDFTPTAYFAALLSLLNQNVSSPTGTLQPEVGTAVLYLLDLVTPHVPASLLRLKFSSILTSLAPALAYPEADGPFLRATIGCFISLLLVQDAQAWALPQSQVSPRKALAALLTLSLDHRPKVRKRAQAGLAEILQNGPPTPSLDHPAADMCAETALRNFEEFMRSSQSGRQSSSRTNGQSSEPGAIHVMQLVKAIASACGGWPSNSLESLCEVLFAVAKSRSEFLTVAAFDVFESVFSGMAYESSLSKLPRLLEVVTELQPSPNDTQLLPPWLAIVSRGYDVSAQLDPDMTFQSVPALFDMVSEFLASSAYNIRVSASECLISFLNNCIPDRAVREPSEFDRDIIRQICGSVTHLLSVKYQSSWMEVFNVVGAAFESFKAQSLPYLASVVSIVGELRAQDSFSGKTQAEQVLSKAIQAVGSEKFLEILPLNLRAPKSGEQGRAWLIPLLRDCVRNDHLSHFKTELVPLSEYLYERVMAHGPEEKTTEIKIFETLIQQIWDTLPGYCDVPTDLRVAFDQQFAELISNLLYQRQEMRTTLCRALQNLAESNQVVARLEEDQDPLVYGLSKEEAAKNIAYLGSFASNLLAVLFNVYVETAPQHRGSILECLDSYLGITGAEDLSATFERVVKMIEPTMNDTEMADAQDKQGSKKPAMVHALMDIVVTMATYLPRDSYQSLFAIASTMISQKKDAQLQKKAYRLIPRLAQSKIGALALQERSDELQKLLFDNGDSVISSAKKERLNALSEIIRSLPSQDFHFIAMILPEIILGTKETNERSRHNAFDLLIMIGEKMKLGGTIDSRKMTGSNSEEASPTVASLQEYLTMLSAGLADNTGHMISASVTAITRVFYHFYMELAENVVQELVQTMELFLKSPSREVVRATLGFIKVCVLCLPITFMQPRLNHLIPELMAWSLERKGHFKMKVKNIIERMIRRFGFDTVNRVCPDENKKLINHIRKQRDRQKRGKAGPAEEDDEAKPNNQHSKNPKFSNEFDEAIYGSESEASSDSDGGRGDDEGKGGVQFRANGPGKGKARDKKKGKESGARGETYIQEDSDEPLDLLDRKALGRISSTRPPSKGQRIPKRHGRNAKFDVDGKLLLRGDDADGDENMQDAGQSGDATLERGINAYVDAIRGRDAARRGQRGTLKFSNKRRKEDDDDGDEVDKPEDSSAAMRRGGGRGRGGGGGRGRGMGGGRGHFAGRGQIAKGANAFRTRMGAGLGRGRGGGVSKAKLRGKRKL